MEQLAAELIAQHEKKQRFVSIRDRIPASVDPYDLQEAMVSQVQARVGGPIAGYKIGLTSKRMQAMCGIDQPIAGAVLGKRVVQSPAVLRCADYGRLALEFELCVIVDADIDGNCSREQILEKIRSVHAAFEIVDDRNADYAQLDAASLIADNCWNEGVVMGAAGPLGLDLGALAGKISIDGLQVDAGSTGDAMGHPLDVVAWVAGHLARRGQGLRAGQLVMTGSLVPTRFPKAGETYRFEIRGLPAVELKISA